MPGFVDFKTFVATDGERVSIVVFDNLEHQHAWRDDPEHVEAQRLGRQSFYAEYSVSVCEQLYRRHGPPRPVDAAATKRSASAGAEERC